MLLISDSNIFIDMIVGDLLEQMFQLPETFAVPDVLYEEELSEQHPELLDLGLLRLVLKGDGVAEAVQLGAICTGRDAPSRNDLMALMLAKQENVPLLTGDRRLRKLAEVHYGAMEIRGTLWLVERLVGEALITPIQAAKAYEEMRRAGSRLPWTTDVARQLRDWGL